MKLFVVSDIHGHASLLKKSLQDVGYDASNENHLLICCGDLFDRGTENYDVLRFFERLERKVIVKGNHDARLLEILNTGRLQEHDILNGTTVTILEFFGKNVIFNLTDEIDFSGKTGTVDRLCDLIGEMKDYYETEHYVFVHGWLPNQNNRIAADWRHASPQQWYNSRWTLWIEGREMPGRDEAKTIVCGHKPTMDHEIYYGDGFITIDAGTANSGKMNVLVLEDELLPSERLIGK